MIQVDLIRRRCLRMLNDLSIFISCLPETEIEAMKRLSGADAAMTRARITDNILAELGHEVGKPETERFSQTYRAVTGKKPGRPKNPEPPEELDS